MSHLYDSNVDDIYNMDFKVNLPSPTSLQIVNSSSRSYIPGYNNVDIVNVPNGYPAGARFSSEQFTLLQQAVDELGQLMERKFDKLGHSIAKCRSLFQVKDDSSISISIKGNNSNCYQTFKRNREEASFRIRETHKVFQQVRDEFGISEAMLSDIPIAGTVPQPSYVEHNNDLQFDNNNNNLSRQVLSAVEYKTFVAPKSLSGSTDSNPMVDLSTTEDESIPVPRGEMHTRYVPGQRSSQVSVTRRISGTTLRCVGFIAPGSLGGQGNIIKRLRYTPTRRVGLTSPRLGEVSCMAQSVSGSMNSDQVEVEDSSDLHGDAQLSVYMADEGVTTPIVVPSIVPTAAPTAVPVFSTMIRDSHGRTQVRWKKVSVDCYEMDEEDADRKIGGDVGCKHGSHALCQGGDQGDHSWFAVGDDDFRHRRRGRGDDDTSFVDQVLPLVRIDQLDEFLEEDSSACRIDCDGDFGSRKDDAVQQDIEHDVQIRLAESGHLVVDNVDVSKEVDLQGFDSSSDVEAGSICLDDSVGSAVNSMAGDSRTDGVVVGWTVSSSPALALIDTELINSLRVSEGGVGDLCTGDQAVVLDLPSCVSSTCVDVRVKPGVGAGWQDVIQVRVESISGRDYPSGVGCTVGDSNTDEERVDVPLDVLHGRQCCASDEVRCSVDVEPCGVLDCQWVDSLRIASSCHEMSLGMRSVRYWRTDKGDAMYRCSHSSQLRSEHVPEECLVLTWMLYLTGVLGTWYVRGSTRKVFDPGGIHNCFHLCTSVLSSPMQVSSIDCLCYDLQA